MTINVQENLIKTADCAFFANGEVAAFGRLGTNKFLSPQKERGGGGGFIHPKMDAYLIWKRNDNISSTSTRLRQLNGGIQYHNTF